MSPSSSLVEAIQRDTRDWLERAVIGLNLCPFARAVEVKDLSDRSVVTLRGDGVFDPGSADVSSRARPLFEHIAKALNEIRKMRDITIVVSEQVLSFALDVADRLTPEWMARIEAVTSPLAR